MSDKPRMYKCAGCDREYPSQLAALDCEEQDELEQADRKSGRMFRSNRG